MIDYDRKYEIKDRSIQTEIIILQERIASFKERYDKASDSHARGLYSGWHESSMMALDALKRLVPEAFK